MFVENVLMKRELNLCRYSNVKVEYHVSTRLVREFAKNASRTSFRFLYVQLSFHSHQITKLIGVILPFSLFVSQNLAVFLLLLVSLNLNFSLCLCLFLSLCLSLWLCRFKNFFIFAS